MMNSLVSKGKDLYKQTKDKWKVMLSSSEVDAEMKLALKMFVKDQHEWKEDGKKEWVSRGVVEV